MKRVVITDATIPVIELTLACHDRIVCFNRAGLFGLIVCDRDAHFRIQYANGDCSQDYANMFTVMDDNNDHTFFEIKNPYT